jgi:uncharacterized protein YbjT (DUF2867 family)
MSKPIIAVMGATGAQGGGLIRALLADEKTNYTVRALTRNPNSDAAKKLAEQGVEIVAADVDDVSSLEKAFRGAHGVFGVTFFWEHFSAEKEYAHAGNIARAAKAANVNHVVWSTLEDSRNWVKDDRMPTLQGKYKVPHFDAKGEANALFANVPTTYLNTSFYWDNFIHFGMGPKRGADGKLALTLPMGDKKLPGIAADDIGRAAYAILRDPSLIGRTLGIAGGHLTGAQMAAWMSRALEEPVVYNAVTPEQYRGFGFPGADDLGNMFQFKRDFADEYCAARDVEETRLLVPNLQTFETWLAKNKRRIPIG